MNPIVVALLIAVVMGLGVFPWTAALRQISSPEYLAIEGVFFLIGGTIWRLASGPLAMPSTKGIFLGLGTAAVYFLIMAGLNYVFAGVTGLQVAIVTAITAAYPIVTALVAAVLARKMLSPTQTVFLLMAVGGVVGMAFTTAPK